MSDCAHEHTTTGELFEWCACGAHRLNASWGGNPDSRQWQGGEIVGRDPSLRDVLAKLEQLEQRLNRRLDQLKR